MDPLSLHHNCMVVNAHCDVLTAMEIQNRSLTDRERGGHVDLARLRQGGVCVLFFAAFIAPAHRELAVARALELVDRFYFELEQNREEIMLITSFTDIQAARAGGKIGALLSIEGGEGSGRSFGGATHNLPFRGQEPYFDLERAQ